MNDINIEKPGGFNNRSVNIDIMSIEDTGLIMQDNILVVAFLIKGELYAKVSCEEFDLKSGDYIVINQGDPFYLTGNEENITAILRFDLNEFKDIDPYINKIIFACESFDLARFRNQEKMLRNILFELMHAYYSGNKIVIDYSKEFILNMIKNYTMENYYNRESQIPEDKTEKYHRILNYMCIYYSERNILDIIAEKEYYSKSYISHLFKEVSMSSFTDTLTYYRLSAAEKLLLTTNDKIADIAWDTGFSDIKYFNRAFKDWFHCSAIEYKEMMKSKMNTDEKVRHFSRLDILKLIDTGFMEYSIQEPPRLSITPLLLKTIGSKNDLFKSLERKKFGPKSAITDNLSSQSGLTTHIMPLFITKEEIEDRYYVLNALDTFYAANITPCLLFSFNNKKNTLTLIEKMISLSKDITARYPFWLQYSSSGDRNHVDSIIKEIHVKYGIEVTALFIP